MKDYGSEFEAMVKPRQSGHRAALFTASCIALWPACLPAAPSTVTITPGPQDGIAYRAGRQTVFRVTADNHGATPQRVLAVTRATGEFAIESGREFAVPGRS